MLKKALGFEASASEWQTSGQWVKVGLRSAGLMFGGLVVLSMVVNLAGAVVASGSVTVEGNYKTIQHLDGGIVAKIHVRNGDLVKRGDPLVRLEDTNALANLSIIMARVRELMIQQARLVAERDRAPAFELPEAVKPFEADPQIRDIMHAQQSLFAARRAAHTGEIALLFQRLEQVKAELGGQETELKSRRRQIDLTNKELRGVEPLFAKGFASQQRLGGLQREHARLEGDIGRLVADIARAKSAISEAELKIAQSQKELTQNVVDELRKVQAALAEAEEQRKTLADKMQRIELRAPEAGRVHALSMHTEGGVIQPGVQIMQIIPDGERLVIDAQFAPQDIDKVRQGLPAAVRFPAFAAHTTPRVTGKVSTVSAAEHTTQQGRTYFTARIEIPPSELSRLGSGNRLVPGMPAEVYIETATRSVLSYLLKPMADAMSKAFRD